MSLPIPGQGVEIKRSTSSQAKREDFAQLIRSVGSGNWTKIPHMPSGGNVLESGSFDGRFSLEKIPLKHTAIKGTDQSERFFLVLVVRNSHGGQITRLLIFQKYADDKDQLYHRNMTSTPLNGGEFSVDGPMSIEKYEAIKKIFARTHPDLSLGLAQRAR